MMSFLDQGRSFGAIIHALLNGGEIYYTKLGVFVGDDKVYSLNEISTIVEENAWIYLIHSIDNH